MEEKSKAYHCFLAGEAYPVYFPYPRFLLSLPLNETARLAYALILDRARHSAADPRWQDPGGIVYVYYTVEELAKAVGKSPSMVKLVLQSLEECGLLLRKRQGIGRAYKLYPCIPQATERKPKNAPSPEPIRSTTPEPIRSTTPEPICSTTAEPICSTTAEPICYTTAEPMKYLYGQVGYYRSGDNGFPPNKKKEIK